MEVSFVIGINYDGALLLIDMSVLLTKSHRGLAGRKDWNSRYVGYVNVHSLPWYHNRTPKSERTSLFGVC